MKSGCHVLRKVHGYGGVRNEYKINGGLHYRETKRREEYNL